VRPFQNADSHTYANILTEIHFAQTAAPLSAHLHQLLETYAVHSGIDALDCPNSQVLLMEPVDASLSQIIAFRRANRWDWGEAEFQKLMQDLVDGLQALHQAGISHNDIRPANVYFSVGKNCYLLGSYATCSKGEGNSSSTRMRGESEFNAPELSHQP
jgi:serine/threonine protein kinase